MPEAEVTNNSFRQNVEKYPTMTSEQVCQLQEVDLHKGLQEEEVQKRLEKYGYNELREEEGESLFDKIKEQFEDLLVRLLLAAAVISFVVSHFTESQVDDIPAWVEPLVIFLILIANAIIGIYQDYNAEKAVAALKHLQSEHALTLRNSEWLSLESREVVPGDIVKVTSGNKVPADMRVHEFKSISFKVNQAPQTGESNAVTKQKEPVGNGSDILNRKNMLFSGTLIEMGTAIGVVTATGMNTELGDIQAQVEEAKEDTAEENTPLKQKLDDFSDFLAKSILGICVIIWVVNFSNFFDPIHGGFIKGCLYYFKVAVALAVAAIPEGLPAVITTCLALGTRRMTRKNAIVKKLPSVETLGCTTVICSDKTGTLTLGKMDVSELMTFHHGAEDFINSSVETHGYKVEGTVLNKDIADNIHDWKNLERAIQCMCLNNESQISKGDNINGELNVNGNSTELAMRVLSEKLEKLREPDAKGLFSERISKDWKVIANLEFNSKRKSGSCLARKEGNNNNMLFIKGGGEIIVKQASSIMIKNGTIIDISDSQKDKIYSEVRKMASKGLRVQAVSVKEDSGELNNYNGIEDKNHPCHERMSDPDSYSDFEKGSTLLALVGLKDPVRREVIDAVQKCYTAGIRVFMVTGDITETALSIGKEIGLVPVNDQSVEKYCVTGTVFDAWNQKQKTDFVADALKNQHGLIFARTAPRHKRMLVKHLKEMGGIIAMTGDGVNDAPAQKQADIGIAMGITGTDVAKESSQMILADDNFSTIVTAVEEGRAIYDNMKAFIRYMISSNIGEVVSIFISALLGIPDGFNSIQLLWVNLVTDGLPATAQSFNPPDCEIMVKPPRDKDENIVQGWVFIRYLIIGTYIGVATVLVFVYWYVGYDWAEDGHMLVSFSQLKNWSECPHWKDFKVPNFDIYNFETNPCNYFIQAKAKASTLSLSVLVMIEMFNAMNAISENQSQLTSGFFANPWLIGGILSSVLLHSVILYTPFFNNLFSTRPLSLNDWKLVVIFASPVCFIEEILKVFSRRAVNAAVEKRLLEQRKKFE